MLEWLDNNDTLMYSTHNEGKSIIAKRFSKTWKSKIYKRMVVNDSKYCLLYHSSINKILFNYGYSTLTKKMKQVMKLLHSKQTKELELISIRVFLVKVTMEIVEEKSLLSILFWKLILGLTNLNI